MKPLAAVLGSLTLLASPAAWAQDLPPGHPPLDDKASAPAPAAISEQELLKQLDAAQGLKAQDKPFEVAAALGKLYYGRGRYKDAADYLDQAVAMAEPTRALYLAQRKKTLAAKKSVLERDAAGCPQAPGSTLATFGALAREKAKSDAPAAAACALAAIEPLREAYALLANARFLLKEPKAALAARDGQLETFEGDSEALFARGAMLLESQGDDLKALARAKADFALLLKAQPASPRAAAAQALAARVEEAIAAGGMSKLSAKNAEARKAGAAAAPAAATPELVITPKMMEAIDNTERTPELAAGFQKLLDEAEEHLARGRFQDALANCTRVVPFEPKNTRAQSGMAWALVQLNKQPMADRVWTLAVSTDPAAVERLGDTLKSKGDAAGAKALWTKLAQSAPEYAPKLGSKLK